MKEVLLIKMNAINLIIETIQENLRLLRQKLSSRSLFPNGYTYHIDMKIEYFEMNLKRHVENQKILFEELCKLN